ncbi:MAG: NADPH-dependent 7-cyano-7-deazaguanine reductase QueF [Phycisphaeraceae bacterium]|nr:NADPH-dependent 7-cyano-7-deazaguanine reductase QueF [Phycisphaeraceae bacterium]
MPEPNLLETFETPRPEQEFLVEHVSEEFTSVCPKTGHPDFGSVELRYVPGDVCVELKSLKLYYQSFRNDGIFYEAVTQRISEDLFNLLQPRWMELCTVWKGRGGIRSRIVVVRGRKPDWLSGQWPGFAFVDRGMDRE